MKLNWAILTLVIISVSCITSSAKALNPRQMTGSFEGTVSEKCLEVEINWATEFFGEEWRWQGTPVLSIRNNCAANINIEKLATQTALADGTKTFLPTSAENRSYGILFVPGTWERKQKFHYLHDGKDCTSEPLIDDPLEVRACKSFVVPQGLLLFMYVKPDYPFQITGTLSSEKTGNVGFLIEGKIVSEMGPEK